MKYAWIHEHRDSFDMRRSFDGLARMTEEHLAKQVLGGRLPSHLIQAAFWSKERGSLHFRRFTA
jgi:hypothetical protein